MTDSIILSTDPERLDIEQVHRWLADSYWSPCIARERVERAIAGSRVIGAYQDDGAQVGFARLITDGATFGWLADDGTADLAVVIRTLTARPPSWSLGVGGGIIIGSDASDELEEADVKSRRVVGALRGGT